MSCDYGRGAVTRILVDTHVFFWWVVVDQNLPQRTLDLLEDAANDVLLSPVVVWELATKSRIGKWPAGQTVLDKIDQYIKSHDLEPLPITIAHAHLGGAMAAKHRDPFDRLLAAQARLEQVPLVTADPAFREFGIQLIW
jgi:PIN domain nuclease of toxin-antitoxin system